MRKPLFFDYPVKRGVKPTHHPFICMDTENDPKTGEFILGAIYGYYKDHHGKEHLVEGVYYDRFKIQDELIRIAKISGNKNLSYYLGLFNAEYDIYYIREIVDDMSRVYVGSRLVTARLKAGGRKGIPIWDATNLVRGSLEDWINNLNMKEKYGIEKLSLDNLEERCLMDTKATFYLFKWLEDTMVYEFGIPLKKTIGSCARELYRRKFQKIPLERNNTFLNDFERKSYRGGRCEVFIRGKQRVKSYDVNSMYLSIMRDTEIPIPQTGHYHSNGNNFDIDKPSIVHCKVYVPDQHIPPLPYMDKKLIFPVGTFEGYWCSPELKLALELGDVKILEVYDYVNYHDIQPLFRDYANYIWEKRKENKGKGDSNLDYMYKTLGNSLYGKYGEQNEKGGWVKLEDWNGDAEGLDVYEWKAAGGEKYCYISKQKLDSKHTFPVIPSWITAHARMKLLREMKKREKWVVYCDTDSIHILSNCPYPIESSKELGGWGFEYEAEQVYYRPKFYGKKRKGVPKRAELKEADEIKEIYEYLSPVKRATAIRRNLLQNIWLPVKKEIIKVDDKRVWNGNFSKPIKIEG